MIKKKYFEPGESISLNFYGRVGLSGTLIDIQADLTEMVVACRNDPEGDCGDSIGSIRRNGYAYDVYVDIDTGKLWYCEDYCY